MRFSWLLLLGGCDFEAPVNPEEPVPLNAIAGTLVANGVDVPTDVSVLVYDARNPGPPEGTGSPVGFATVPARAFTGTGAGLQSAPFQVTGLPDGDWLINAIMDTDANFNPLDPSVAGATCGDIVGRHVTDLVSGSPAPVHVEGGQRLDDVTVAMGTVVPFQRPAFFLAQPARVDRQASLEPTSPQQFTLRATAVHSAFTEGFPLDLAGPCPASEDIPGFCDPSLLDLCDTAFWAHLVDANADGLPDLREDYPPEAGIPAVWPRVFLRYLGEEVPSDASWSAEAFPFGAELGAYAAGLTEQPPLPIGQPTPLHALPVTWAPVVRHTHPDGALTNALGETYDVIDLRAGGPLDGIPAGAWSVTVIAETGQTWQLPNALATVNVSTQPDAFDPAGQAGVLDVQ